MPPSRMYFFPFVSQDPNSGSWRDTHQWMRLQITFLSRLHHLPDNTAEISPGNWHWVLLQSSSGLPAKNLGVEQKVRQDRWWYACLRKVAREGSWGPGQLLGCASVCGCLWPYWGILEVTLVPEALCPFVHLSVSVVFLHPLGQGSQGVSESEAVST